MKIGLTVQYLAGESKKIHAQFADFIAFERDQNRSVANFQTELKLTDLAWLAWHSEKRNRNTALDFDKWIETVDSVEVGGDGPIVPLGSPQPTG
jgi:hypothetical protein